MYKGVSGIYLIRNIVNDKIYVGSSINIAGRWYEHKNTLKKNKHHNIYLQFAWNKHGEDNFSLEVLEIVVDENNLIDREQYWMDKLECYDSNKGYNILPTAGSRLGKVLSEESKTNIAKGSKIRKPILQIDVSGNIVNEYFSINNADKTLGISRTSIKKSMREKIFFREYAWVLKEVYLSNKNILSEYFITDESGQMVPKRAKSYTKGVIKIGSRGKKTVFDSVQRASQEEGVGVHAIRKYCELGEKDSNNNIWMYEEDYYLRKVR